MKIKKPINTATVNMATVVVSVVQTTAEYAMDIDKFVAGADKIDD